ncbi:MAG: TerB family tellurite resistance protein [Sedimentisphaerales bacterium]|nr:TerB family tellurite resistance protein [Sedimentisphaerales bacterium]
MPAEDKLNCLKNLIAVMCCDGTISETEKKFLGKAARQLEVSIENWNALLRQVQEEQFPVYPIHAADKALATLRAMVLMAKADKKVDEKEKVCLMQFAKSIGVTASAWNQIIRNIDSAGLFEPFQTLSIGSILLLRDDFEHIDIFLQTAKEQGACVQVRSIQEYLQDAGISADVVCFHAAADYTASVNRCKTLLGKAGDKLICLLTRWQGMQVQYLLEIGLRKCVIEPVYPRDIEKMFLRRAI